MWECKPVSLAGTGIDVLRVAVGADPMAELRRAPLLDVTLDGLPRFGGVTNPLAIRADRQQPFQLLQLARELEA